MSDIATRYRSVSAVVLALGLLAAIVAAYIASEWRWSSINNPTGKFTTAAEYLAIGRLPESVVRVEIEGRTYFIAHSPMDSWLAMPSGPAAYVFDETGQLVDWSPDVGDDMGFNHQWNEGKRLDSGIEELQRRFSN